MRIKANLSPEEKQFLESRGVVFGNGVPHFEKKTPLPADKIRLSSGEVISRKPIAECLKS